MMSSSAISTTKSKSGTAIAYAGLNFAGDRLRPERITALLGVEPTVAYRKGETFKRSRGHEVQGRTGLWRLATKGRVESTELADHLDYLKRILFQSGGQLIGPLCTVMRDDGLEAEIDCFWHGERNAASPEIPETIRGAFAQIGAAIETDFDTD